jgi:aspartyl/glutamyl-tRNA(Asn/Gln) amidotransferase C subunit
MDFDMAHLARLSRLDPRDPSLRDLSEDLKSIVGFVGTLTSIPDRTPEESAREATTGAGLDDLREDVVTPSFDRSALLAGAPSSDDGCYAVPVAIEKGVAK